MSNGAGPPRVAVVGAGIGGLAAARALCKAGLEVVVYEKDTELGGLAARCSVDGLRLDRYYHFVCGGDAELIELCRELGIPITWQPTRTSFYYEGKLYPFGSARHLLTFGPLSLRDRYRQGRMMLSAYRDRDWRELDDVSAEDWLIKQVGERAYQVIWYPLLKVKFGEHYREISAAWIWHRVHRVLTSRRHALAQERLGFMQGGAGELIERVAQDIRAAGGSIRAATPVDRLARQADGRLSVHAAGEAQDFDAVVCSLPAPAAVNVLGADAQPGLLGQVEYIGVVCLMLLLDRALTNSFWINTNDSRIAFNGFIEFSNLNPRAAGGLHLAYVPYYCHPSDPRFAMSDDAVFEEFLGSLQLIQPDLARANVEHWRVFRDLYAQPVCTRGFARRVPPFQGPWEGLFTVESSQLYPADRNLSGAIALAGQVAQSVVAGLERASRQPGGAGARGDRR